MGGVGQHIARPILENFQKSGLGKLVPRGSDPFIILSAGDEFEVTNPRDRVYALVGLINTTNYGMTPDYTMSIEDVYYHFSMGCLVSGAGLRLITTYAGSAIRVTTGLPSWCMDFGPGRDNAVPFNELAELQCRSFSASTKLANDLVVNDSHLHCISLHGAFVDTITSIGPLQDRAGIWPQTLAKWLHFSIETLLSNHRNEEGQEQPFSSEEAHQCIKSLTSLLTADNPAYRETAHALLLRYTKYIDRMQEAIWTVQKSTTAGLPLLYDEMTGDNEWYNDAYILDVYRATCLRRLCLTSPQSRNLMGLVHGNTQVGDQIWILPGANVPVILRAWSGAFANDPKDQDSLPSKHFELVGDTFVQGIMEGELQREDWFRPERIVIH